jgi:hypothetical protein
VGRIPAHYLGTKFSLIWGHRFPNCSTEVPSPGYCKSIVLSILLTNEDCRPILVLETSMHTPVPTEDSFTIKDLLRFLLVTKQSAVNTYIFLRRGLTI